MAMSYNNRYSLKKNGKNCYDFSTYSPRLLVAVVFVFTDDSIVSSKPETKFTDLSSSAWSVLNHRSLETSRTSERGACVCEGKGNDVVFPFVMIYTRIMLRAILPPHETSFARCTAETQRTGAVHDHTPGFYFFLSFLFHFPRRATRAPSFSSGNSPVKPPDLFDRYVIIQTSTHTLRILVCDGDRVTGNLNFPRPWSTPPFERSECVPILKM